MVWWCGGVVARWCGGVGVVVWWCGGVVVRCGVVSWCGGVASWRLKDASLDQQRCQLFPFLAMENCKQVLSKILQKQDVTSLQSGPYANPNN